MEMTVGRPRRKTQKIQSWIIEREVENAAAIESEKEARYGG